MSAPKHTPGPWEIFAIASEAGVSYRIHAGNTDIAHIPMAWSGDGSNARLIAAAPKLLFNLEQAIALLRVYAPKDRTVPIVDITLHDGEAAIAKAEGRS